MTITIQEQYQDDYSTKTVGNEKVKLQSKMKVSGFMPDQGYSNIDVVYGGKSYSFNKPSFSITNTRSVNMGITTITVKDSLFGNKAIIQDKESGTEVIINPMYNFFGKKISQLPTITINGANVSYQLRQASSKTDGNTIPLLENASNKISLIGNFNRTSAYEFELNGTLSSNQTVEEIIKLIIFNTLIAYLEGLLTSEAVISHLVPKP